MSAWGFLDSLGQRSRPLFGQVSLYALLLCAAPLTLYFQAHHGGTHPRGERAGPATVLSWLPDALLLHRAPFHALGVTFALGGVLWVLRRGLPWSSWGCALSFVGMVALYLESASQATHVAHLTCHLLLVHALWYHFYVGEVRAADRGGVFWTSPLYPRWVHAAGVFAVGWFYGWAGLSKLLQSGPGWADGVSLQLWVRLFGDPGSAWTRLILEDRRVALALQVLTLAGETSGFVAIVWRAARPVIGLVLIGFHVGQIAVFGWGFHANMVLLALFLLPCDRWLRSLDYRRSPLPGSGTSG